MKKLLVFLAIIGIIAASNCTRIPENNDPVIGIWAKTDIQNTATDKQGTVRQEWIFNDAYLGRYHSYTNNKKTDLTDFSWSIEKDVYTISYPGTDKADHIVHMKASQESIVLEKNTGEVLAVRE